MTPEFSHEIDAATVSETARAVEIAADETQRRRLAGRFRLPAIDSLSASITLQRRAGIIHAEGEVRADVVQACVVTDEPLPAKVHAPFHVRYVADHPGGAREDEIELSEQDCETLPIENGRIDLGELVAETLALALDPYPRSPQADAVMLEREESQAEESSPFAALKVLKSKPAD